MSNEDYKNQRKKFMIYIVGIFAISILFIYLGLRNRLPIRQDGITIEPKLYNAKLITGIVLLIASILFTIFLVWIDKKTKSLRT
jgi:hypothetical protein